MMEKPQRKTGKIAIGFGAICILAVAVITGLQLMSGVEAEASREAVKATESDFDHKGDLKFERLQSTSQAYLAGSSSDRTLEEFYARRQYPGSPPSIPHPLEEGFGADQACLSCHEQGGWVAKWSRHTPVTPHPDQLLCEQCHLKTQPIERYVETNWQSVSRPRLGNSSLPGSPPVFPHGLQMREDCVACHTGPGAVIEIRTNHAIRGDCRQCHMPFAANEPFQRDP